MQPDKTPPCGHSKLLLLRKLPDASNRAAQWRMMLMYYPSQQPQVDALVAMARVIEPTILFRTTTQTGQAVASDE